MVRERYSRRRRWIVGSVVLTIAVVIMILTPPPRLVQLVFNDNYFEMRRNRGAPFEFNHTVVPATEPQENTTSVPITLTEPELTPPPPPDINEFEYLEEPPVNDEMKRLMTGLSTQGAVCADVRRIGGMPRGPHGAPRPLGPDGMWYVCFDEEMKLNPMSCIVYSFGVGDDFSFDEKMGEYGCDVFAFDPSMGRSDHNHSARVQFFNLALSDINQPGFKNASSDRSEWKTRTLATIIQELGHSQREIDVLKIDIESDEWKCLRHMLAEGTLKSHVRQLNIEYHVVRNTADALRRFYSIAKWLERQGFEIFHTRRNPYCPECWEMSYINTNLVKLPLN